VSDESAPPAGGVDDRFSLVRPLAAAHAAWPFPDCRGEEIDGVDLVLVDADLHGCVAHFLREPFGSGQRQRDILSRVSADLDRIQPSLPDQWADYFGQADALARALLRALEESPTP
jgi:hypothetical protein